MGLPSSFAVGKGCSQAAVAPIIPIDILSQGGLALCASWVREPLCAWVHIRCPRSIFPSGARASFSATSDTERCIYTISQLLEQCKDSETPWTIEASARSTFWATDLGKQLLASSFLVDLTSFGSSAKCLMRLASSLPTVLQSCTQLADPSTTRVSFDAALGKFYRALASSMLSHLQVSEASFPSLAAAQVATGLQPRKPALTPVPEFKRLVQVAVPHRPALDSKGKLLHELRVHDTVVPAGSKLMTPSSLLATAVLRGQRVSRSQKRPVQQIQVHQEHQVPQVQVQHVHPVHQVPQVQVHQEHQVPQAQVQHVLQVHQGKVPQVQQVHQVQVPQVQVQHEHQVQVPQAQVQRVHQVQVPQVQVQHVHQVLQMPQVQVQQLQVHQEHQVPQAQVQHVHQVHQVPQVQVQHAHQVPKVHQVPQAQVREVHQVHHVPQVKAQQVHQVHQVPQVQAQQVSQHVHPVLSLPKVQVQCAQMPQVSQQVPQPCAQVQQDSPQVSQQCPQPCAQVQQDSPQVSQQCAQVRQDSQVSQQCSPSQQDLQVNNSRQVSVHQQVSQQCAQVRQDSQVSQQCSSSQQDSQVNNSCQASAHQVITKSQGALLRTKDSEAELIASGLDSTVSANDLVSLFETLPAETPARGVDDAREKAWTAGAYSQNKLCGLRRNTRAFPCVVAAAVKYLRGCFPGACFATIAFYSNVGTPMHRDCNNMAGTLNYVTPLTSFEKGGIWVQDETGDQSRMTPHGHARGRVLQVSKGPVQFDAHSFHCTLPWLGSRIVLIGFTPKNVLLMKQEDTDFLLSLGFPLPGAEPSALQSVLPPVPEPDSLSQCNGPGAQNQQTQILTFGVYHTECEFVRAAVKAGHPRSLVDALPEHLDSCVDLLAKAPPHAVIQRRKQWLDKWTARAAQIGLSPDPSWGLEDAHMHKVLQSKRLQLLDEIIATEGYDDVNLARDIREGFDLVGTSPVSNVLPGKVTPASLHPDDVCNAASRANEALQASLGSSGDHATDVELWRKTMQEVDRGWLLGPYSWDALPAGHVVSHRFPLWQHDKLRPIDDYSRSGVNACVTTLEQPTVDTADVAAAMFAKLCERLGNAKRPSWVKGRSFDLTAAYRQLCVSVGSRKFAVVAVYDPHSGLSRLFTQVCLPFGSRASVNGFIRCSRCIQWLATRCLLVPTTSYYDDFIVASPDCLSENTGTTMELLFRLLGWLFDTTGPKADVFSRSVMALGLHFDLSGSGDGVITVDNTSKRKSDIQTLVSRVLEDGCLSYKGGMELRGKLSFANSQIMGKAGHYALKHVSAHVHAYPFVPKLCDATADALRFLLTRILEGQPRRICRSLGLPWFIFTDASFEPDFTGGLGGVLIAPSGSVCSWFSLLLESNDVRPLLPLTAETGIGELETAAVVLAVQLWQEHLESAECIAYLDNEGARLSLIRGTSASWAITRIAHVFATTCDALTALPWLARVPSCSNLADHPSRGKDCNMLPCNSAVARAHVKVLFDELVQSIITLA